MCKAPAVAGQASAAALATLCQASARWAQLDTTDRTTGGTLQGATWTQRRPHPVDKFWNEVASSGDGLRLLAMPSGYNTYPTSASSPCLFLSEDGGESWKQVKCTGGWGGIAVSADGNHLFASNGSSVLTSTDGNNWRPCGSLGVGNVYGLAASADGRRVLAASLNLAMLLSDDGCASWDTL